MTLNWSATENAGFQEDIPVEARGNGPLVNEVPVFTPVAVKDTDPVGTLGFRGVTEAMIWTDWPGAIGLSVDVTETPVEACFTTSTYVTLFCAKTCCE